MKMKIFSVLTYTYLQNPCNSNKKTRAITRSQYACLKIEHLCLPLPFQTTMASYACRFGCMRGWTVFFFIGSLIQRKLNKLHTSIPNMSSSEGKTQTLDSLTQQFWTREATNYIFECWLIGWLAVHHLFIWLIVNPRNWTITGYPPPRT